MKQEKIFLGIGVLILLAGSYYAYGKLIKNPTRSKEKNIDIIVSNNYSKNVNNGLDSFEDDFLNSWATAIIRSQKTFDYKGKTYNIQGGTAVKN
jgi:hypothetical protein